MSDGRRQLGVSEETHSRLYNARPLLAYRVRFRRNAVGLGPVIN